MGNEFPYVTISVDTWATYVEGGHVKEIDHIFANQLAELKARDAALRHIVYAFEPGVGYVDIMTFDSRSEARAYARTLAEVAEVEFNDFTVE